MAINPLNPLGLDPARVQTGPTFTTGLGAGRGGFQSVDPLTGAPPTGLIGSENALTSSADNALRVLRSGRNTGLAEIRAAAGAGAGAIQAGGQQGIGHLEKAVGGFDPFASQGTDASGIQAALSGAMGVEAQQQALANLKPVSDFLTEQGERALTRNAAAMGGVGGGNVRRELVRFGQGLAGESAQQQFNNLSTVADRGLTALRDVGNIRGQQANISLRAGEGAGNILNQAGQQQAALRSSAAANIANVFGGTGTQIAQGRQRVGEQIAQSIGGTTSSLANLVNQQGQQAGAEIGAAQSNLANLLSGAGQSQSAGQGQLATLLANLATQQGSTVAGLPGIPGIQQTEGIIGSLGQAAGGAGAAMTAFSDERLKKNIVKTGITSGGLNSYEWDWTDHALDIVGDQMPSGVMAMEAAKIYPDAVTMHESGYMQVDYSRIG